MEIFVLILVYFVILIKDVSCINFGYY